MTVRSFSYGGGVQSTAALVLAAQGELDYPLFVFANTGDDSENPDTLTFVHDVAMPYGTAHGLDVLEVRLTRRDGTQPTLKATAEGGRGVLPVYTEGGPAYRTCTTDWKIRVIERELRARGATVDDPAHVGLGISTDEIQRARTPAVDPGHPLQYREYPLIDLGLDREDCRHTIAAAGLPIPPKSSCWFCPFQRPAQWRRMRDEHPARFADAIALEEAVNRGGARGRKGVPVYLSPIRRPLAELLDEPRQLALFADAGAPGSDCDSGYCMT